MSIPTSLTRISELRVAEIAKSTAFRYVKGGTQAGGDSYVFNRDTLPNFVNAILKEVEDRMRAIDEASSPDVLRAMREASMSRGLPH